MEKKHKILKQTSQKQTHEWFSRENETEQQGTDLKELTGPSEI